MIWRPAPSVTLRSSGGTGIPESSHVAPCWLCMRRHADATMSSLPACKACDGGRGRHGGNTTAACCTLQPRGSGGQHPVRSCAHSPQPQAAHAPQAVSAAPPRFECHCCQPHWTAQGADSRPPRRGSPAASRSCWCQGAGGTLWGGRSLPVPHQRCCHPRQQMWQRQG